MRRFWKQLGSLCIAAALGIGMAQAVPVSLIASAEEVIFHDECENLDLSDGTEVWTSIYDKQMPGYSGDGFIYLTNSTISLEVTAPEDGMYDISVRYAQILDQNGREQTISINGSKFMYKVPYTETWQDYSFGVHRLNKGVNTIQILPQYGYACYDTITVTKADLPDLSEVQPTLSDSNSTAQTQSLMNYLCSVYGNNIISGQQEIYGGGHDGDYEYEFDWLYDLSGEYPAIRGFDFMNYNPLYGWDDNTTERIIDWVNEKNGIATCCWHINVPQDFDSYTLGETLDWTKCTYKPTASFDTSQAVVDGTKENDYLKLAMADLAEQIGRLQDAGVPIILRPFHEAEGNGGLDGSGAWFWWGSAGAETYKQLWNLLYTTLTEEYDLHNIIWEENLYTWSDESAQWYVGDAYCDMVGYDKYNTVYNRTDGLSNCPNEDAISSTFYGLVDTVSNNKLVAMAENDTVPNIENLTIEKAGWLYFCPWYEENLMDSTKNNSETLKDIYQSDYCITLDELPSDLYTNQGVITGTTTASSTEQTETTTTELEEGTDGIPGDFDHSGTLNGLDLSLGKQTLVSSLEIPVTIASTDSELVVQDMNQDGEFSVADIAALIQFLIGSVE